VVLLDVVAGLGSQRVVEMYHVGAVSRASVTVLVAVHVQSHVTQSGVEHLPATTTDRRYTAQTTHTHSAAPRHVFNTVSDVTVS